MHGESGAEEGSYRLNSSFVATVGTGSKHLGYRLNPADSTFELLEN